MFPASIFVPLIFPALPDTPSCVLHAIVVRLEIFVAERPVLDGGSSRNSRRAVAPGRFADDLEVPRVETPRLRHVVHRRAADAVHHRMVRAARRVRRGAGAAARHFAVNLLRARRPGAALQAQFIRHHVPRAQPAPGLEADHVDPRVRERQRRHAAGGAHADNHSARSGQCGGHAQITPLENMSVSYAD